MDSSKIKHLFWRAGFGLSAAELLEYQSWRKEAIVEHIFDQSSSYRPIELGKDFGEIKRQGKLSKEERKENRKKNQTKQVNVNYEWMRRMSADKDFLREKLTLFWHDHFASDSIFAKAVIIQQNTIRKHALSSFRDLLHAMAKDPQMLLYLNNQQNRKTAPNENFAREVMELFTLGPGHYTEQDIKQAARAFTGWQTNLSGQYVFREQQHDFGSKTIFGKSGKFTGEAVLDMILDKKQTAYFITEKLYRYFVNPKPNKTRVQQLADYYYKMDYDTEKLLKHIFLSSWFYDEENMASKLKSPVELLVGLMKPFNIEFSEVKALLLAEKILGQVLLKPPNVAGWPADRQWIDSSSLLYRMKLPQVILLGDEVPYSAKESIDANDKLNFKKFDKKSKEVARVDWTSFKKDIDTSSYSYLGEIATVLWNVDLRKDVERVIHNQLSGVADDDVRFRLATAILLGMPEYQVC